MAESMSSRFISETVESWSVDMVPSWGNIKGLLLGAAACPLLLISIYFFKASPGYISKEHFTSWLAYVCAVCLLYLGITLFHFPIVMTALQTLPLINQMFVSSLALTPENCISIFLTAVSIYTAAIGYSGIESTATYSWLAVLAFASCFVVSIIRLFGKDKEIGSHLEKMKISDFLCMSFFALESSVGFVSLCSFALFLKGSMIVVGGITSIGLLMPIEKALYYYPASAVIPVFTMFLRVWACVLSYQMFTYGSNLLVGISLITGIASSIFPLMLS
ncbi:hypothetical protein NECID01_0108 [Nematocida sp. AWRm77]|nr:hypothetical protein NECID01_0108 [Nematocida sp. AWRm77]